MPPKKDNSKGGGGGKDKGGKAGGSEDKGIKLFTGSFNPLMKMYSISKVISYEKWKLIFPSFVLSLAIYAD